MCGGDLGKDLLGAVAALEYPIDREGDRLPRLGRDRSRVANVVVLARRDARTFFADFADRREHDEFGLAQEVFDRLRGKGDELAS